MAAYQVMWAGCVRCDAACLTGYEVDAVLRVEHLVQAHHVRVVAHGVPHLHSHVRACGAGGVDARRGTLLV